MSATSASTIAELDAMFEAITVKKIAELRAEYEERIHEFSNQLNLLRKPAVVLIGSKFKWISASNTETYRIAIMTANGLLQVKSVVDGAIECDTSQSIGGKHPLVKKLFANEAEWRASLPQGNIELSLPSKVSNEPHKEESFLDLSDVEKIDALIKRYKIRHSIIMSESPQQRLNDAIGRLDYFRATINKLSYDDMLQQDLFSKNKGLQWLLYSYSQHRKHVAHAGADADKPMYYYSRNGTGSINAMINGQAHFITLFDGKIATVPISENWGAVRFYKNFAEMGNPAISILYHKRVITI
jgi:hypothetical protein